MVSEPWASTPPSRCWSRPRRTRPWSCGTSRRLCRPRSRRPSTWSRSIHSEPTPAPSCRWPSHPPVTSAFRGALIAPYGYGTCPTPAWTLTIASVSTYLNPIMPGGWLGFGVASSGTCPTPASTLTIASVRNLRDHPLKSAQIFTIFDPYPSPVGSFYYYPSATMTNFLPLDLQNSDVLNGWSLRNHP